MELTCALFVALVGLVAATPSGYGVKGGAGAGTGTGAVAKAEANSGAFAGSEIPGSVPFPTVPGATVSGSYAKSSASNFAASSSSASSSSFSFSGSGVIPGKTNCQTGKCPTGNYGSGNTGNAIAAAGAAAAAKAGTSGYGNSNTPCSNGNCQKPTCQGSICDDSDNECPSGDCSGSGSTSDSNDIAIDTAGSPKSSYGIKSPTPSSGCSNGKCDNTNPDYEEGHISSSAFQTSNKPSTSFTTPKLETPCSSPNCGSAKDDIYDKNKPSSYNVPILVPSGTSGSVHTNDCASGKCQDNPTQNSGSPKFPSYPATASTSFVSSGPRCSGSNCGGSPSSVGGAPSPLPKYPSQPQPIQPSYPSTFGSANAGAPLPFVPLQPTTKKLLPYTGSFGGPPGILKPNDFTVPSKISNYKPTGPANNYNPHNPTVPCTSGNCKAQPSPVSPQQGSIYPFGGQYKPQAQGCTSGNCGVNLSQSPSQYKPSGLPSENQFKPPSYNSPCANGNCQTQPSQSSPGDGSYSDDGSYKPDAPTGSYTPSSCSSGNCGSNQVSSTNQHTSSDSASASSSAAGCFNGNCGQQPQKLPSYKPTKPTTGFRGPSGFLKPNEDTSSSGPTSNYNPTGPNNSPSAPCSSGICGSQPGSPSYQNNPAPDAPIPGFGAPSGVLKPNDYISPSTAPTSSYKPSGPAAPCSTGTCTSSSQYNPSGGYNPSAPAPGFGGPAGMLKPIDHNSPSNAPVSSYKPSGPANPTPSACSFGNCGPQPGTSPSGPQYNPAPSYNPSGPAPGFGGPAGVLKPIYQNIPSNAPVPSYKPSGPASPTPSACSFGNCGPQPGSSPSSPQYNPAPSYSPSGSAPGFGGPAGVLKPIDQNIPSNAPVPSYKPSGPASPTSSACSFGNCGPQPGSSPSTPQYNPAPSYKPTASVPGFGASPGVLKPNDYKAPSNVPTSSYKPLVPTPCSSGICGTSPQINPLPGYQPPAPGFGGPVSIYKPSGSAINPNPSACTFGNCGPQPIPSSPHYNQVPSYKPTTAPVPGFGAPPGVLKPNYYNAPSNAPTSSYQPVAPTPCSSGICGSPQNNPLNYKPSAAVPGFGEPSVVLKPDYSAPPDSNYKPAGQPFKHVGPCSTGICGQPEQSSSQYNPAPAFKPAIPAPASGGPTGAQNPNYNSPLAAPVKNPAGSYNLHKTPCSTGNCAPQHSQTDQSPEYKSTAPSHGFGGPAGVLKPNDYNNPSFSKPIGSAGPYSSAPCTTGNCGTALTGAASSAGAANSYGPGCTSGNCGAQPSHNIQSGAGAYSFASAKAVAYTGGFGGPPGLIKPFDGKDGNAGIGAQSGSPGFYGKSLDLNNNAAGSGAQAGATAGAAAGSHSGNHGGNKTGGCSEGCGGSDGSAAVASVKSVATAGAGAGAYGNGGSFASSSATAHASATAGAATKGGYGR